MFTVLLSFSESLATKCLLLNDDSCMVRPTLIDINTFELKYDQFMINLNKCTGICVQKYVFQKKQKADAKAFNMITNKNEAKAMIEHISCDCKCKFNSITCNSK